MAQEVGEPSLSWKNLAVELRHLNWWPLLLAPAAAIAVSIPYALGDTRVLTLQNSLDEFAPFLIALAAAMYVARAFVTRNPLYIIVAVLATAMTIREIHFEKIILTVDVTKDTPSSQLVASLRINVEAVVQKGIYVVAVLVAVWAVLWHKRLIAPLLGDRRHWSWLTCTLLVYFISVVVSRRLFKFVPGERAMHRVLEETLETTAHLMFIVTSLLGNWRRSARDH